MKKPQSPQDSERPFADFGGVARRLAPSQEIVVCSVDITLHHNLLSHAQFYFRAIFIDIIASCHAGGCYDITSRHA